MARRSRKAELLKQEIISSIPVEQRKIIKQPITFSYLNGEMTMMQTRIQTMIMEKLQGRITKALKQKAENGFVGDLFTESDFAPLPGGKTMYLTFEVRYSELGVEPSHYDDVDKAARAMQSLIFEKEVTDENGKKATEYTVVFDKVTIPNKDKDSGNVERRDSVKLRMLPETARDMFRIIPYQKYLKDAVFLFSSNYAGRIYLLINVNKDLGKWECSYDKLRRILLTSYDKNNRKSDVSKYSAISDFKKRVLEPAKKEILEAADRIDCTFDYEFRYPAGKKRGIPETVIFHIHLTELGRKMRNRQLENNESAELRNLLVSLHLSVKETNELIDQLEEHRGPLLEKAQWLKQYFAEVKAGKHPDVVISNFGGYAKKVFQNFVIEQTAVEAVEIDSKPTTAVDLADAPIQMEEWGNDE